MLNHIVLLRFFNGRLVIIFHFSQVTIGIVPFGCFTRVGTLWLVLRLLLLECILVGVIENIALCNIIQIFVPPLLLLILEDCFRFRCEALASNSLIPDEVE